MRYTARSRDLHGEVMNQCGLRISPCSIESAGTSGMRNNVFQILLITWMLAASTAWAEDKDPFFSAGPRSSVSASVPQDSNWGRDPFSKPFEGKTPPAASSGARARGLTGIIYGQNARIAIIDGETYREGGRVGDQKLVDIRKRSVVLMNSFGIREEIYLEDFSIGK
jgi:hypothetical protein